MRVMAFGAHPDDIEIGMGGTVARYVKQGHEVTMVVATVPDSPDRIKECEKAASVLGAELVVLNIPQDDFTFNRKMVGVFDKLIEEKNPDEVYTQWLYDSHQDHVALTNIIFAAARKNKYSLYMYEQTLPSGITGRAFNAQLYVDISDELVTKIESLKHHSSQILRNSYNWIESVEGRGRYRGFQINTKYAEAFEIIKQIRK